MRAHIGQSRLFKLQAVLFFFLLSLSWGCAQRARLPLSPDQVFIHKKILNQINERAQKIHALSGSARVVVRTPEEQFSADEIIRLRPPSTLRLETWNAMGGLQLLVIAKDDQGVALTPGGNRKVRFSTAQGSLKRFLGVDLSAAELLQLLTGTPPLNGVGPRQIRATFSNEATLIHVLEGGRLSRKVWIDSSGRALRWERLNTKGKTFETIVFEDFREVSGLPIPFKISYTGSKGTEFVLQYRSLFLNQPIEDKVFEVPE